MEVKGTANIIGALENALPHIRNTGMINHLAMIKPDPRSKGGAIMFKWQKRDFRLTANLKVSEYVFGIDAPDMTEENEVTKELEDKIRRPFVLEERRLNKNAKARARRALMKQAKVEQEKDSVETPAEASAAPAAPEEVFA